MFKRAGILACAVLILMSSPADAASLRGRGPRTEAAMDAHVLEYGSYRIQVLTQLCANPSKMTGCAPIHRVLRRAIEDALGSRITWVHARPTKRPLFVVFAPVAFGKGTALAEYAWWEPPASGCRGGGEEHYQHDRGTWRSVLTLGWTVCRASHTSGTT